VTLSTELKRAFPDHFRVLILDNEVTVGAFVADPPFPWARLTADDGTYRVAPGHPTILSAAQADHEKLNWDTVSNDAICAALAGLDDSVELVAFGNNAAQGLPLARALPAALRKTKGVVIFGRSLPEQTRYEALGYARFCRRDALIDLFGKAGGRPLALAFINTIGHNERNYHAPWNG